MIFPLTLVKILHKCNIQDETSDYISKTLLIISLIKPPFLDEPFYLFEDLEEMGGQSKLGLLIPSNQFLVQYGKLILVCASCISDSKFYSIEWLLCCLVDPVTQNRF